jgi:hypothetical protein
LTIHFGLAAAFSTPELELGEDEAKALADGMANVAATYDHNMNPRTLAWAQMAVIAGGIYGTRVFAIRARQAKEARGGNEAKPVLVVNPRKTDAKIVERPGGNISTPLTPADIFGLGYGATIPEGL